MTRSTLGVLTESSRQRTMLVGIVKRQRLIVMRSAVTKSPVCSGRYPRCGGQL